LTNKLPIYCCASPKATARDDDFASALLEIHDEDPNALTHEEIGSILYSLTFKVNSYGRGIEASDFRQAGRNPVGRIESPCRTSG
jgi:hypothetical protein